MNGITKFILGSSAGRELLSKTISKTLTKKIGKNMNVTIKDLTFVDNGDSDNAAVHLDVKCSAKSSDIYELLSGLLDK